MTDDIVIRAEGVGKKYIISHEAKRGGEKNFREAVSGVARGFVRSLADMARGRPILSGDTTEEFWALKDVSFDVKRGEVLGIIGRNGAGKSTLLKILSRITDPSEGRVTIKGRVASLLEVGTGFHPELTGRENIFLNGGILGMTRVEIRRKFDEIVAFAGVERFIDTPVKRYSSGMYVRLAFAVAAHLEPEILVVDEVLAVGDLEFQKKCLGKMHEVADGGRTVLFVSHQMTAIQNLCGSAILIEGGQLKCRGETTEVVNKYLTGQIVAASTPLLLRRDRTGSAAIQFVEAHVRGDSPSSLPVTGDVAVFELWFNNTSGYELHSVSFSIGVDNDRGDRLFCLDTDVINQTFRSLPLDTDHIEFEIPILPLAPGRYAFTLYVAIDGNTADWIKDAGYFDVVQGDFFGTGRLMPTHQSPFLVRHSIRARSAEKRRLA